MTYEEALAAAKDGKKVAADWMGEGWHVVFDGGQFWDVNPYTGTHLRHGYTQDCRDRSARATWKQVLPYEYAGFRYYAYRIGDSDGCQMKPLGQQHPSAAKHKHVMAAVAAFEEDLKDGRVKW